MGVRGGEDGSLSCKSALEVPPSCGKWCNKSRSSEPPKLSVRTPSSLPWRLLDAISHEHRPGSLDTHRPQSPPCWALSAEALSSGASFPVSGG